MVHKAALLFLSLLGAGCLSYGSALLSVGGESRGASILQELRIMAK